MRIDYIITVWGETYVERYMRYALPNQLAPGGLGDLAAPELSRYVIYCRACDIPRIAQDPLFARLRAIMEVEFRLIRTAGGEDIDILPPEPHRLMSCCHEDAVARAAPDGAGCAFLVADAVLGDGSLLALERRARDGAEIILVTGVRSVLDSIGPWLETQRLADGRLPLAPRAGVAALRRTSGRYLETARLGSDRFQNLHPALLWIPAGDDGLVGALFHPHPIYVRLAEVLPVPITIDHGSYVQTCVERMTRVDHLHDSDEFLLLELSDQARLESVFADLRPFDRTAFRNTVKVHTKASGRRHALTASPFRGLATDEAALAEARAVLSAEVADLIPAEVPPRAMTSPAEIARDRRVFFYGAGDFGAELKTLVDAQGPWRFAGYVDTFRRGEHNGCPVYSPEAFAEICQPEEDQVIVTSGHVGDVVEILAGIGVQDLLDANPWRWLHARALAAPLYAFSSQASAAT